MASVINEALAVQWLDVLRLQNGYASLHFEVPSVGNPLASEFDGPTYARANLTWHYLGARSISNIDFLEWLNLSQTTVEAIGVWDAPTNGELLVTAVLDTPVQIGPSGAWSLEADQLVVAV